MSLDSPAPPIPPPTQDSHRSPANLAPASTASTNHDAATTGSRTRSGSRRSAASVTHQPATRGRGRLAVTSKFAACWSGDQPLGSQFQIGAGWSPTFPIRHSGPFSPARSADRDDVKQFETGRTDGRERGTPTALGTSGRTGRPRPRSSTTGAPAQRREHGLLVQSPPEPLTPSASLSGDQTDQREARSELRSPAPPRNR